jgi:hypothetical protein
MDVTIPRQSGGPAHPARIGGGTLEMHRNNVAERHLCLPREPSFDRDVPFNQPRHNTIPGRS